MKSTGASSLAALWPFLVASMIFTGAVATLALSSYRANGNHLVYALDDAYIHMAIAKNILNDRCFGVTPYEFSSSSSSPLWTLLLATVYSFTGVAAAPPLALNYLFGLCSLFVAFLIMRFYALSPLQSLLGLLLFTFVAPLVPLVLAGMEHVFHIFAVLLLVYFSSVCISPEKGGNSNSAWALCASSALAVAARYESLFLVSPLVIIVGLTGRRRLGILCAIAAILPVCAYGAFSVSRGGFFIPDSLILKGAFPHLVSLKGVVSAFGYRAMNQLAKAEGLYGLLVLALGLCLWNWGNGAYRRSQYLIALFACATILHCQFADIGWFYRYEAYLRAIGTVVVAISIKPIWIRGLERERLPVFLSKAFARIMFVALCLFPSAQSGGKALASAVQATRNIYEQQYQMGLFFREFYNTDPVAANDVGAVNYLSSIRCLDLWGQGSHSVARTKMRGQYSTSFIKRIANEHGTRVAVLYRHWFRGGISLPSDWIPVGEWTIRDNVVCAGDTVTFFAVGENEVRRLSENLRSFSIRLPKDVRWRDLTEDGRSSGCQRTGIHVPLTEGGQRSGEATVGKGAGLCELI
jgi:hypothetical protein